MKALPHAWLFEEDGKDFRGKMIDFIRRNFGELLGEDVEMLDRPGGFDLLREKVRRMMMETKKVPSLS